MKTIIVPMDFSNEALPGLRFALVLANKSGANIKMVHVINKDESSFNEKLENKYQWIEQKFKELIEKYKGKINFQIDLNYIIKEGKVFKEINELADSFEMF